MEIILLGETYKLTGQFLTGMLFGAGMLIILRLLFESWLVVDLRTKLKACKIVRNKLFKDVEDFIQRKLQYVRRIEHLLKELALADKNNIELGDVIVDLGKKIDVLYIQKDALAVQVNKLRNGGYSKNVVTKDGRIEQSGD